MTKTNSKNDYLSLLFNASKRAGTAVEKESEIQCEKCGTINPPSSHYCRHCGTPLSSLYQHREYSLFSSGEYTVVLKTKYYSLKRKRDSLKKTVASLKKEVDNYLPNRIKRLFSKKD